MAKKNNKVLMIVGIIALIAVVMYFLPPTDDTQYIYSTDNGEEYCEQRIRDYSNEGYLCVVSECIEITSSQASSCPEHLSESYIGRDAWFATYNTECWDLSISEMGEWDCLFGEDDYCDSFGDENALCDGTVTPFCGDNICNGVETSSNCPGDCPVTNPCDYDHTCESGETQTNCPSDCGTSPPNPCDNDNTCEAGETVANCPGDCEEDDPDELPWCSGYEDYALFDLMDEDACNNLLVNLVIYFAVFMVGLTLLKTLGKK